MSNEYYILEEDGKTGPFTFDELTGMQLDIFTQVATSSTDEWQNACDLPELYTYFEKQGIYLPTGDNLASFWIRLLAFAIDLILLSILTNVLIIFFASDSLKSALQNYTTIQSYSKMPENYLMLIQSVVYGTLIIYNSICEISPMKGSVGKRICRIVVVDVNGYGISFPRALLRNLGKVISLYFLGLGFLSIFWSEHRQAMQDYIAKTYVVKLQ